MRSLIIHLPRATARADNVALLLKNLPNAEVVEAVDGNNPATLEGWAETSGTLHHPPYPFGLTNGEIACYLSHRRCWDIIAKGDAPYALVAEDDMTVDPVPFAAALDLAGRYANEDSFIRFPAKTRERANGAIARQGGAALFMPRTIGLQSICQIIGRNAARRLLDISPVIDRPVDTTLQMHWVTGQRVLTILPSGIAEMGGPSTIQGKTRAKDLLLREVRRASNQRQRDTL